MNPENERVGGLTPDSDTVSGNGLSTVNADLKLAQYHEYVKEKKKDEVTHRDLVFDLAAFLEKTENWIAWTNLPLGSVVKENVGIADVVAVMRSFSRFTIRIYEVKVSRSDFTHDVNTGKFTRYFQCCSHFYFAVPGKLIKETEVPEGCGLITRSENHGWHVVVSPRARPFDPPRNFLLKLLIAGFDSHLKQQRIAARIRARSEQEILKRLRDEGHSVAKKIAAADSYISEAEVLRKQIESISGYRHASLEEAAFWLVNDIGKLTNQHQNIREAVELADITVKLFHGDFLSDEHMLARLKRVLTDLEISAKIRREKELKLYETGLHP